MVRYSEVLSALSFALDMVEGEPQGHIIRTYFIGMTVGRRLGLTDEQRSALFYALLMKDAGCSSNSAKVTALFDSDDFDAKRALKTVDWSRLPQAVLYIARTVRPNRAVWTKARRFLSVGLQGPKAARELIHIRCERGAEISRLIGFPEETALTIRNLDEHWDGAGHPDGLEGEEIPLLARICGLAQTTEVFYSTYGPDRRRGKRAPGGVVRSRVGGHLSGRGPRRLDVGDTLQSRPAARNLALEPEDQTLTATTEWLDLAARAFARIIDAKSPFTYEHSERVAETAAAMSEHLGLSTPTVQNQIRAGLLHDIGKLGISSRILDKPRGLTNGEFAEVNKHSALTYEILSCVAPFNDILERTANHHQKLDSSGYPRSLTGESLDLPTRIRIVADIFDALSSDRPYRPGMPMEKVLGTLDKESGEKLCPTSAAALQELVSTRKLQRHHEKRGPEL